MSLIGRVSGTGCSWISSNSPLCFSTLGTPLTEERFTVLEEVKFGRFSYQGQNPGVEAEGGWYYLLLSVWLVCY